MATRGSYVHNSMVEFLGASQKIFFCAIFSENWWFQTTRFTGLLELIHLYKQKRLQIFFLSFSPFTKTIHIWLTHPPPPKKKKVVHLLRFSWIQAFNFVIFRTRLLFSRAYFKYLLQHKLYRKILKRAPKMSKAKQWFLRGALRSIKD